MERELFAQGFCHCKGSTSKNSPLEWPSKADHDAVDTNGHFLSTISSDLIYCMFGSTITHEPNKKNTIGTRISSSRGGHKSVADVWMHKSSSTLWRYGWGTRWNFLGVAVARVEFSVVPRLEYSTQNSTWYGVNTSI
jgi:hypothetical protein